MKTEQEAITAFEQYLDGIAWMEGGKPIKRRHGWSIGRINFARQMWIDCWVTAKAGE